MATCRKFGVRSWPQVKLFKYGKYEGEYYGAEDACKFTLLPQVKESKIKLGSCIPDSLFIKSTGFFIWIPDSTDTALNSTFFCVDSELHILDFGFQI